MSVVKLINALLLHALLSAHAARTAHACDRPWMFFDLGETIVDTKTHDFKKIFYMPKAHQYLAELSRHGYPIGLIVNVPESWGPNDLEKIVKIRSFIEEVWSDDFPMNWSVFDVGIFVPPYDVLRKPSPFLFSQAVMAASQAGCEAIYQGEENTEITAARDAGMIAYKVGQTDEFFLPLSRVEELVSDLTAP